MGAMRAISSRSPWLKRFFLNEIAIEVSLITAIVLLGVFLRFFHLGTWSFWTDEVFSFGTKSDGFNDSLLRRSLATDLIRWFVNLRGASEWNARFMPAVIGVITIPLLYLLLRRCIARPAALAAAALLAVSPWHLYWSQNARFYSLLFLFFNLGLLLFYLGLEDDRPLYLVIALALFGMAARERLVALLGMPALVLYLLAVIVFRFPRPRGLNARNMLIFFGPAAAAGLVYILPYARNLSGWFAGFYRINNTPFFLLAGTLYYVGLPLTAFAGGSALLGLIQKNRLALLLLLMATIPLVSLMALSLIQYTANRYIFFTLFCWIVLAGLGFQFLVNHLPRQSRLLSLLVIGALLAAYAGDVFLYYTAQNGNRDDWRAALTYIAEHAQAGDTVVTSDYEIATYYLNNPNLRVIIWDSEQVLKAGRVWYVEDMTIAERYPQQLARVKATAQPMADFDVHLPARTFRMRVYFGESPYVPHPKFLDKAFAAVRWQHVDPVFLFLVDGGKPVPICRADGSLGIGSRVYWAAIVDELAVKPGGERVKAPGAARPGNYSRYFYHRM